MNNPGTYVLAALGVTAPLSAVAQTPIVNLDGVEAVTLEAVFNYGSGGTSCSLVAQVTFDGGTTWLDVARFDFTNATAVKVANLNGMLSKAVTAYAALGSEGVNDGVLAGQWRGVVTSTGTYVNTTVSLRLAAR